MKNTVNILGTEYKIEIHKFNDDSRLKDDRLAGYCCSNIPLIVIADMDDTENFRFFGEVDKTAYLNSILRHEIIHAFLNESGIKSESDYHGAWADNEEMIDWIAIQFPKIYKVYEELGVI